MGDKYGQAARQAARAEYMRLYRMRTGVTKSAVIPTEILGRAIRESPALARFLGDDLCEAISDSQELAWSQPIAPGGSVPGSKKH